MCLRCGAQNPSTNEYCFRCGTSLDKNKLVEPENNEKEVETAMIRSQVVDNGIKEQLKTVDPDFKDKILE